MRYILRNIIIIILIGIIGYQYYIYRFSTSSLDDIEIINIDGTDFSVVDRIRDTVYVHVYTEVEKYVPKYITRVDTVKLILPLSIDTAKIFFDYFLKYTYSDTLNLKGLGRGYLTDVITQNRIQSRSIIWDYSIPVSTETIMIKPVPKNTLWVGPDLRIIGGDFINSVGGSALLQSKRDKLYELELGVGANPNGKIRPYIGFGYYWKLTD
jgi:hypothetical protein